MLWELIINGRFYWTSSTCTKMKPTNIFLQKKNPKTRNTQTTVHLCEYTLYVVGYFCNYMYIVCAVHVVSFDYYRVCMHYFFTVMLYYVSSCNVDLAWQQAPNVIEWNWKETLLAITSEPHSILMYIAHTLVLRDSLWLPRNY